MVVIQIPSSRKVGILIPATFTRFFCTETLHVDSQCSFISHGSKVELLGRDPDPFITQGRDPDPDEHNDYFNFSLIFLHLFPIEVNWTENSKIPCKYELLGRDQDPSSRDPDPDEHNDHFNFSLVFFGTETLHVDSQCSFIVNWTENFR